MSVVRLATIVAILTTFTGCACSRPVNAPQTEQLPTVTPILKPAPKSPNPWDQLNDRREGTQYRRPRQAMQGEGPSWPVYKVCPPDRLGSPRMADLPVRMHRCPLA